MPKWDSGFFQNRPDANRELLLALVAAPQETLVALASQGIEHLVHVLGLAVRAMRRAVPNLLLEKLDRQQFVRANERHSLDDFRLGQMRRGFLLSHVSTLNLTQGPVNIFHAYF